MDTLFDLLGAPERQSFTDYTPPEFPLVASAGITKVYLNFETNGLKWFDGNRPIGCGIGLPDGRRCYLPWAHLAGGNLDEATAKRWAQRELRDVKIININTRFDVHMGREWGVDFEAQNCTVSDVGHYAALLDDHRMRSGLDTLVADLLPDVIAPPRVNEAFMQEYHPSEVAARAIFQTEAAELLEQRLWPQLDVQDLQRVRQLEDDVIYPVCEMEKNGSPIDVDLLDRWIKESQKEVEVLLLALAKEVGFQVNPGSLKDQVRVFQYCHAEVVRTEKGRPSFKDVILKTLPHPTIKLLRRVKKLMGLRSKFIVNTKEMMGSDGILRYAFNQLRTTKDEFADAGEVGTVTGRFSSTEIVDNVGVNIQQRMKAARQRLSFGYEEDDDSHDDEIYLVRRLHIAKEGLVLTSDMDQAQYRIFASYANNPRIIEAYRLDPTLSFHKYTHSLISPYASLSYRGQKDLNFAYLFGAGLVKMALMLGHITDTEFESIKASKNYNDPKLAPTKEVKRIYEEQVPEVKILLAEAMHLAKPACDDRCKRNDRLHKRLPHRGYVRTPLGRRSRFPEGNRLHKAFNSVDQGTEADVMKRKLVLLHSMRKETGLTLRITNHDEVVGDIPDEEHAKKVDYLVNQQEFPELRVPLTWSTSIGANWAACNVDIPSQFGK